MLIIVLVLSMLFPIVVVDDDDESFSHQKPTGTSTCAAPAAVGGEAAPRPFPPPRPFHRKQTSPVVSETKRTRARRSSSTEYRRLPHSRAPKRNSAGPVPPTLSSPPRHDAWTCGLVGEENRNAVACSVHRRSRTINAKSEIFVCQT